MFSRIGIFIAPISTRNKNYVGCFVDLLRNELQDNDYNFLSLQEK